jgi:lysophospholipase L1-like esterase
VHPGSAVGVGVGGPTRPGPQATTAAPNRTAVDRTVFVEGDSLTVGISAYLPSLLAADGWTVTVDGQIGRATPAGISILADRALERTGTLVVALGTNDSPDPGVFSSRIDQVMHIAAGRRVIWVTVARAGWDGLDSALLAASTRWPNLHVIDWRPVIAAHPAMQAADGVHLTTAGYQLRAQFIAAAIETDN